MILIVDDKPENIFSLKKLLELHGFAVDAADSGEEALKKILQKDYSLIILDVQMPGMDGFEVAETISGYSKSKDIPIIFLSAVNTDKRFVSRGYASGGIDYITKPVDPDILIHKVRTLHDLTQQNRELNIARSSLTKEVEDTKLVADELNERVEELQSVLESIPQIAFTTKPDGNIEFVNDGWYLYANSINHFPNFYQKDEHVLAEMMKNFAQAKPFSREARIENLITKEYRYHLIKLIPIKQGKTVSKWVGTFTDIHEQKVANQRLEEAVKERTKELSDKNEELEASNHELQQFAYVASHDLKEPLRKIQLFSSMLESEVPAQESAQVRNYIEKINESSKRMSELINDLLDYSRLSVDALFKRVNLNDVVKDIVQELDYSIQEKNASLHVEPLPSVDAIPGQIRQVFQNLVVNALKFSKKGVDPVITIRSQLVNDLSPDATEDDGGSFCRITVTDNGIGFDEMFVEKVFTIFQRLNPRGLYEGTGIGLAIAKKIIGKHNGIITARSVEGQGSTFILILPLHQDINQNNQQTIERNERVV